MVNLSVMYLNPPFKRSTLFYNVSMKGAGGGIHAKKWRQRTTYKKLALNPLFIVFHCGKRLTNILILHLFDINSMKKI